MVSGRYIAPEQFYDNGGRISLSTDPVPSSDVTSSSVYFLPFRHNYIGIYDGSNWIKRPISGSGSPLSISTNRFQIYDVFAFNSSGIATMNFVAWNTVTGNITSVTNAGPAVVTATANGRSIGDLVGLNGIATATALNGAAWRLSAVATNTFTLEDSVAAGAGTGGTWALLSATRATSIGFQDGIPVRSGTPTQRFIGTFMTWDTAGQCEDSEARRMIFNQDNQVFRPMRVVDTTDSWTWNGTTYREARGQNNKPNRFMFIAGSPVQYHARVDVQTNDNNRGILGIGINTTTTAENQVSPQMPLSIDGGISAEKRGYSAVGFNFVSWLERIDGGVRTFSGDDGLSVGTGKSAGMIGGVTL